ncbi:protein ASPARTIC PROTEASE IN GUARD cell 2 [Dorcoceras hygrometricum]|uniref:Protein ASPARTIC PROTEASE IN GUARD cell 2 n=1 Tax=Dorcoceras hygrometricum TaxID=472368 RepID=A0A2Z7AD43_9LAMI|nr:protein ASPARTIC PROTEASE IN GUARD cell 2 [Dorcoceras hygrometricum]
MRIPLFPLPLLFLISVAHGVSDREQDSTLQIIHSLAAARPIIPIAWGSQVGAYVVKVNVGTPTQPLLMAVGTSSDASLVPCDKCSGCSSTTFDSTKSSTFNTIACGSPQCSQVLNPTCGRIGCGFSQIYGNSNVTANLAGDTLTLADNPIPGFTFGCVRSTTGTSLPAQGLLGLGRGPLSLISQTPTVYQSTFSYCLPTYKSSGFTGSLKLGPKFQPVHIKSTPLLKSHRRPSLYYVNLIAIRVGINIVNIPPSAFAFNPDTGAGTIFDTGVQFTTLVKPAYVPVRDEFRRRMGNATVSSLGGFDTCYTVPVTIPSITFMFTGMNVTLPPDNFLIRSTYGSTTCLAMAAESDGGVNSVLNVIGSFQQQNHRILIEESKSRLSVAREPCS